MSKIGKFFKKVWNAVKSVFENLDDSLKTYIPVVVTFCEGLKKTIENGTFDTLATLVEILIPGETDDKIITAFKAYLVKNLPTIIANLQLVDIIAEIDADDVDTQMKAIITYFQSASSDAQDSVIAALATKLSEYFDDGEFTKAERHALIDWYYTNYVKAA